MPLQDGKVLKVGHGLEEAAIAWAESDLLEYRQESSGCKLVGCMPDSAFVPNAAGFSIYRRVG